MKDAYKAREERKMYLRGCGFNVEVRLSCGWLDEQKDPNIHQFLTNLNLRDPLCPREGYFGGQTNALRLDYEFLEMIKILRYDIVGHYPSVNKTISILGHPEIILKNSDDPKNI